MSQLKIVTKTNQTLSKTCISFISEMTYTHQSEGLKLEGSLSLL